MAYGTSKAKNEEHAFKTIEKEIKEGSVKSPIFLFGKEGYLIQWAVSAIVEKYISPAVKELDFSKIDGGSFAVETLISQCETLPMLSEKRIVLVEDFPVLAGNKARGFSEEDEAELTEYLKTFPESCLLIFTGETADKRRKLYKTIGSTGACYEFSALDEKSLKSFIDKRLKRSGKFAKPSIISKWIALSGYYDKETDYTIYNLENDIRKVIAFSDGEEIVWNDIAETSSGNIETYVFSMIDALSENRKGEAFRLLHNLLFSGEKEYKLLALICSQLEVILMTKELADEGRSFEEMKGLIDVHEFRIRRAIPLAGRYSQEQLKRVLSRAYEIDRNIKRGILDARLALEMLIASV